MPTPAYKDLVNLSSNNGGLVSEGIEERVLSMFAIMASGQNPDGSANTSITPVTSGLAPATVAQYLIPGGNAATFLANQAWYMRCLGKGTVGHIEVLMGGGSSGNLCVGVYTSNGGVSPPTTLLATSGSVPTPAAGVSSSIALGTPVVVNENCYLAVASDNATTTLTGTAAGAGAADAYAVSGWVFVQASAFPLPATANISAAVRGQCIALYGLP